MALLASCQSRAGTTAKEEPRVPAIEVRDDRGELRARVHAGRPCRAEVEGLDMQIGVSPLVAMVGATRWESQSDPRTGTMLLRDGKLAARIFVPTEESLELFDAEGVAMVRTSGPQKTVLEAVLSAPKVSPEVRAITACHLLNQPTPQKAAP